MTSLFLLTNQYRELAHKLADGDFDSTTIADTIDASGLVDDIQIKCQNIEHVARGAELYVPTIDAEIERLQKLKAQRLKVAQGLRDYILKSMEAMSIQRIECPLFTLSIRKNPSKVDIFCPDLVPAQFMVTPEPKPPVAAPDKAAIAKVLKAGVDVPGARLTQGMRLHVA